MFIDDVLEIKDIAKRSHLAVFALKEADYPDIKAFYVLEPNGTGKITMEAASELSQACTLKQSRDTFIIIKHADALLPGAANSLLKLLEEPGANYHFILYAEDPSALLPTILSRAKIYYLYQKDILSTPVSASEEIKNLARELLVSSDSQRITIANTISKKKDARIYSLSVLSASLEIAYKSYFATGKPLFLSKIPGLLKCYDSIKRNGHVKLHIVADLC